MATLNNNKRNIIPEVVLYNIITLSLQKIKDELLKDSSNKNNFLYKHFNGISMGDFVFYDQGKELMLRGRNVPRNLQVNLFFNTERASSPTIHIAQSSESDKPFGMGNQDQVFEDDFDKSSGQGGITKSNRFMSSSNIIITSDNTFEVIFLYSLLKTIFSGTKSYISSVFDLDDLQISGEDLAPIENLVPQNIYYKSLRISFEYDLFSLSIFEHFNILEDLDKFVFCGNIIDPFN